MSLEEIISEEKDKLTKAQDPGVKVGILFNIVVMLKNEGQSEKIYPYFKDFIAEYVRVVKFANFGYDSINFGKIDSLLELISPTERVSVLQYAISVFAKELPEYDRSGFVRRIHRAEIKCILDGKNYFRFPKVFFLFWGQSVGRLLLGLLIFFIISSCLFIEAPLEFMKIFNIESVVYSNNVVLNHFLNVLSLFSGLENGMKVIPGNWLGLLFIVAGKVLFFLIIINFFYRKLSDKISQK